MSLARIRSMQKKLIRRYREIGIVASRYVEAGLHVRVMHPTRYGHIHVLATGNRQRLAIDVYKNAGEVDEEFVNRLVEKARLLKAKPILILYGDGPRISGDTYKKLIELGVKVRRIKSSNLPTEAFPRDKL